jgi:saxitoxin biosynthesis operon SxtJ-like protein
MNKQIGNRQLRSFGLIVGAGFSMIGVAPLIFRHGDLRTGAAIVGAALIVTALVSPMVLEPVHRGWMKLAEVLGWVNTRLILLAVYYAVIVPIAGVLRVLGRDPLRLKLSTVETSYRVPRAKRPASHMQRQY